MKGQLSSIGLSKENVLKKLKVKNGLLYQWILNAMDCRIGLATSGGLSKKLTIKVINCKIKSYISRRHGLPNEKLLKALSG